MYSRYEIKYLIPNHVRIPLQTQIASRMRLDPHTPPGQNGYIINTYYLDSPDLTMYHEKLAGLNSRTKVRIRYYGVPNSPIKLEIKEHLDSQIVKSDYKLSPATLQTVLRGEPISAADPADYAVSEYHRFLYHHHLRLKLHMTYLRCAYTSSCPGALRITFDTRVRVRRCLRPDDVHAPEYYVMHPQWSILELKFAGIMPSWINAFVQRFSMLNESVAKYIWGINRLLKLGEMADPTPRTEGFPGEEQFEAAQAPPPGIPEEIEDVAAS